MCAQGPGFGGGQSPRGGNGMSTHHTRHRAYVPGPGNAGFLCICARRAIASAAVVHQSGLDPRVLRGRDCEGRAAGMQMSGCCIDVLWVAGYKGGPEDGRIQHPLLPFFPHLSPPPPASPALCSPRRHTRLVLTALLQLFFCPLAFLLPPHCPAHRERATSAPLVRLQH